MLHSVAGVSLPGDVMSEAPPLWGGLSFVCRGEAALLSLVLNERNQIGRDDRLELEQ